MRYEGDVRQAATYDQGTERAVLDDLHRYEGITYKNIEG